MRQQPADLAIEHADELGAARDRNAEQALDRQRVGVLLVHRRDIVEPIEIGHVLQIGARLHQLLGAAMQQADMRIDALDHFAVELQHQPQHAVRRRMLRPEVDREVAEVLFGHGRRRVAHRFLPNFQIALGPVPVTTLVPMPIATAYRAPSSFAFSSPGSGAPFPGLRKSNCAEFLGEPHRLVADALFFVVVAHFDEAGHREILAQRMAVEAVVGEDAAKIRMAVEQDAEQVVDFALVPVGGGKDPVALETGVASSVAILTRTRRFSLGDSR